MEAENAEAGDSRRLRELAQCFSAGVGETRTQSPSLLLRGPSQTDAASLTVPGGCALTVVPRFRKRESPQSRASSALLLPPPARTPSRQGRRLLTRAAPVGPSTVVYTEIPTGLQLPSNHSTSVAIMKR